MKFRFQKLSRKVSLANTCKTDLGLFPWWKTFLRVNRLEFRLIFQSLKKSKITVIDIVKNMAQSVASSAWICSRLFHQPFISWNNSCIHISHVHKTCSTMKVLSTKTFVFDLLTFASHRRNLPPVCTTNMEGCIWKKISRVSEAKRR